jgi:DNA-binding LacI/PurR family transcriptional regulator
MQAIVAGANDAGYSPLVFLYQQLRRDSRQRDHLTLVGGAIFDSAAEAAEYAALAPDLPIVSLQKNTGHAFDEAYPDDYRCGQEIAARIAGTGKVRLALLGELRRSGAYTPLVQGYIDGALLHDLELPFTHLIECGPDPHEAAMVVTGLLHRADKCPQVVLCTSDQVAVGVMDAAARLSLSVPGDLWVIGNGDTAPGRLYALTSISVDFSRLAEFAIQTITRHHGERSGGPLSCAVPNIIQVRSTAALPLEPKSGTDY